MVIDYNILALAQQFYAIHGFKNIEVPWTVEQEYHQATFPERTEGLCPVGSGEQGIIKLREEGLPPFSDAATSKIQTITPCFRPEDAGRSPAHFGQFMKLELYELAYNEPHARDVYNQMGSILEIADTFMEHYRKTAIIKTKEGHDIVCAETELELGSYGVREFRGKWWVYGTGLALPRFSM